MHRTRRQLWAPALLIGAVLLGVVVLASGCGKPAPQSAALLDVAASPAAVRDRTVVAFLRPSTTEAQLQELRTDLPRRGAVESWAISGRPAAATSFATMWARHEYGGDGAAALRQLRASLGGQLPAGAFYVLLRGGAAGPKTDLINWLLGHDCVFLVHDWVDGTLCGATEPMPD